MSLDRSSRAGEIASRIIDGDIPSEPPDIGLDELIGVYRQVAARAANPYLHIVSFRDRLIASFPELGDYPLFVRISKRENPRQALSSIQNIAWFGPNGPGPSGLHFLVEEIKTTWKILVPIFGSSLIAFAATHNIGLMKTINEMAMTTLSIFVGIFALFTVGHGASFTIYMDLFKAGYLHDFLDADRRMTTLALVTLLGTFLNAILLSSGSPLRIDHWPDKSYTWCPVMMAAILTCLSDLLISVPRYYFRRTQTLLEIRAQQIIVRGRGSDEE